ncbi:MAG: hypothetical protein ACYC9X_10210 [Dehalococcoidia bacterium]
MDPQESTIANADLWTRYFEQQWAEWLRPLGASTPVSEMAEGTAARIAGFFTLVAAGPIAWLYAANAPSVSEAIARQPRPLAGSSQDEAAA